MTSDPASIQDVLEMIDILAAVAYYAQRPGLVLPRLPITVGRILGLFEGSGLAVEARRRGGLSDDFHIGYGKFICADGKPQIEIERRSFVMLLGQQT